MTERTSLLLVVLSFGLVCNGIPVAQVVLGGNITPVEEKISESRYVLLFKEGIDNVKTIFTEVEDAVVNIDKLMNNIEEDSATIVAELGSHVKEAIDSSRPAIITNRNMIADLREAKIELKKFAIDTQIKTGKLITFLSAWSKKYNREKRMKIFKRQLKVLQLLVEKSEPILENAAQTYRKAARTSQNVKDHMGDFQVSVDSAMDRLVREKENKGNLTQKVVNGIFVSPLGSLLTLLDLFGNVCDGKCKQAADSLDVASWDVPLTVRALKCKMTNLGKSVSTVIENAQGVLEKSNTISDFIADELVHSLEWGQQAKSVQEEIKNIKDNNDGEELEEALADFDELLRLKDDFSENLESLRDVATSFVDLPIIFEDHRNPREDFIKNELRECTNEEETIGLDEGVKQPDKEEQLLSSSTNQDGTSEEDVDVHEAEAID